MCVRVCVDRGHAASVCECPWWLWLGAVVGGVIAVYWSPAAWCLRNEGVSSVLLGASNTDQLMENIGAIQVRLQRVCVWWKSVFQSVKIWPDLLHKAPLLCLAGRQRQPPLLGTARPLGQFAAARSGALLYCVNKVRGVSVATGIGDTVIAAPSSSPPDKMHPFNGVFQTSGFFFFSFPFILIAPRLARSRVHFHSSSSSSVPMLCASSRVWAHTHISVLDVCSPYASSPSVHLIFQFWNATLTFLEGLCGFAFFLMRILHHRHRNRHTSPCLKKKMYTWEH